MLKIAVCEDNPNDLAAIEKMLSEIANINIDLDVFTNGHDLLHTISIDGNYDIYFLDIHLPRMSGIDIAREIRKNSLYSILIFVTANPDYIFETQELISFDYIVKPITSIRLRSTLLRAEKYLQKNKFIFKYQFNKIFYCIECNEIYFFYKSSRKAYIYTKRGIKECNLRICDIIDRLNQNTFVQVNRSYIINLGYIERFQRDKLYINGQKINISEMHREELTRKYLDYIDSLS